MKLADFGLSRWVEEQSYYKGRTCYRDGCKKRVIIKVAVIIEYDK